MQRPVQDRLEARQQGRLEVARQNRMHHLHQLRSRDSRVAAGHVHDFLTAEVGSHQNHAITKIDFATFAVAHGTAIKHLVKHLKHIAVCFFDFVEQDDAIRSLPYRLCQYAAAAIADITRWRAFQLRYRMRLLVF